MRDGITLTRCRDRTRTLVEHELLVLHINIDDRATRPFTFQDLLGDRVLKQALDRATQWTGTKGKVGPFLSDQTIRSIGHIDGHVLLDQTIAKIGHHEVHDLDDLVFRERLEHDDLIDTVQELRTEQALDLAHDAGLDLIIVETRCSAGREPERCRGGDLTCAHIRGHDDDRIAEVDHAPLRIGQATFLQDLEQDVEDIRMRFLDLVEEHDRIRALTHCGGKLATLVIAHVPRRRTDQARHRMLLHVFRHVKGNECILRIEQELCKRFRELGLAHT